MDDLKRFHFETMGITGAMVLPKIARKDPMGLGVECFTKSKTKKENMNYGEIETSRKRANGIGIY